MDEISSRLNTLIVLPLFQPVSRDKVEQNSFRFDVVGFANGMNSVLLHHIQRIDIGRPLDCGVARDCRDDVSDTGP